MKKSIFALCMLALGVGGCATDTYTGESKVAKTAWGTGIGTVVGAGVGVLIGGEKGALIGAGVGAAGGALVGGYMDIQAKELRAELVGSGVQVATTADGQIHLIMPSNITFATDSSVFQPSFNRVLDSVAKVLSKYDKTIVAITGHTDNTGTVAYNNQLSLRRAAAVADYLKLRGVATARLGVSGAGSSYPIASNDTEAGRAQNRRVEVSLQQIN
jgi:outer membrane protein OmpA-like peptidoglycan-associated protein